MRKFGHLSKIKAWLHLATKIYILRAISANSQRCQELLPITISICGLPIKYKSSFLYRFVQKSLSDEHLSFLAHYWIGHWSTYRVLLGGGGKAHRCCFINHTRVPTQAIALSMMSRICIPTITTNNQTNVRVFKVTIQGLLTYGPPRFSSVTRMGAFSSVFNAPC